MSFPAISRTSSEGAESLRALARASVPSSSKLRSEKAGRALLKANPASTPNILSRRSSFFKLVQDPSASASATPPSEPTLVEEHRKSSKTGECSTILEIAIAPSSPVIVPNALTPFSPMALFERSRNFKTHPSRAAENIFITSRASSSGLPAIKSDRSTSFN
ncbi:hypothetical protein TorRG33x02_274990 [Trema orientale]|uniref:Uncharacterized protein n=1 Tax=Trema orientale TaxID=63057 RepID=A0A2P5CSA8_TREOI|nr:hypothetical protein TorRG33x02_274990 [Trema orientale]